MSNIDSNKVPEFLIRIAADSNFRAQYDDNPAKVLDDAGIPEEKKAQIMSGDIEKVQSAVGIQAVCFVLTHSEI